MSATTRMPIAQPLHSTAETTAKRPTLRSLELPQRIRPPAASSACRRIRQNNFVGTGQIRPFSRPH